MKTKENKNHFNFSDLLIKIYVNLKENSLKFHKYQLLFNFFDMINNIIIIDIIFNYKKNFIDIFSYTYLFNYIFYFELLNNYLIKSNNNSEDILSEENYKYDQISLIINKQFNINIYNQYKFKELLVIKIVLIALGYLCFIIMLIDINKNSLFIGIKKICSIFIYIFYKGLINIIILIFFRKIFIQFSISYNKLDNSVIIDLILIVFMCIPLFIFNNLFIYSFGCNEKYYFLKLNLFLNELIINFLSCIIITLRFNIKFSIIFQLSWILLYFHKFYFKSKIYIYNIFKNLNDYIDIFFEIIILSKIIIGFISILVLSSFQKIKFYKIIEKIILFFLIIVISFILFKNQKHIHFSQLIYYFNSNNSNFLYGIYQLFEPFKEVIVLNLVSNKISEKNKELILTSIQKNIKLYFCTDKDDFEFLNNDIEKIRKILFNVNNCYSSTIITNTNPLIDNNSSDKFLNFNNLLLSIIKLFYKSSKKKSDNFNEYIRELMIYYKILFYYVIDGKTFRTEYILKKFLCSKYYKNNNCILSKAVFNFLDYHFQFNNVEENSSIYALTFFKLNSAFYKIVNSFKYIIDNFSRDKSELLKITLLKNKTIGKNLSKIIKINKQTNDSKIKENVAQEKLTMVEAIIFNSSFDKSIENFDLNNIDLVVEKNTNFFLLYRDNDIIIKKAPLKYNEITEFKTTKLKNKSFVKIFPDLIGNEIIKEIKKNIFSDNNKIITVVQNYNGCISLVKLILNHLPSFKGKLYLSCTIECNLNTKDNVLILTKSGLIKKFGQFFLEYFGLSPIDTRESNFLNLINKTMFNLVNLENNSIVLNVNFDKMCKNIRKNIFKSKIKSSIEYIANLENLKKQLKNKKSINIKLILRNIYYNESEKYYVITTQFDGIIEQKYLEIQTTVNQRETQINSTKLSLSSIASVSQLAVLKDKDWNVTSQNKNKLKLEKNKLGIISLIYNFILIIAAIVICIIIYRTINNFKETYNTIYTFITFTSQFYYNQFYFINKVVIKNNNSNNNFYDVLSNEFQEIGINLTIADLYIYQNKILADYYSTLYNEEIKQCFEKIDKKSKLWESIIKKISFNNIEGGTTNTSYQIFFPEIITYNYVLSQIKGYYLEIEQINYNVTDLLNYINRINSLELKYAYYLMTNYKDVQDIIFEMNTNIKDIYTSKLKNLKIFVYVLIIIFIGFNILSCLLLYLSINLLNNNIVKIIEKIVKVENNHLFFLRNKIKITKLIIIDELKATIGVVQLKNLFNNQKKIKNLKPSQTNLKYSSIDEKDSGAILKKSTSANLHFLKKSTTSKNNYDSNVNFNNTTQTDEIIFIPNDNKKIIINKVYIKVFQTIFFFILLYIIFMVIILTKVKNYFSDINHKLTYLKSINDLSGCLFSYFFINKLSIYFNTTYFYDNYDMNNMQHEIFGNYSSLIISLTNEKSNKYKQLVNILNSEEACDNVIISQKNYTEIVSKICKSYQKLHTNFQLVVNGIVGSIRQIYLYWYESNRDLNSIIKNFHHKNFQFENFSIIIYVIDAMNYILYQYITPDFNSSINKLNKFVIIMLSCMVFIEIFNYIQNNIFILNDLSKSISNYKIIEKFFVKSDKEKKEKKPPAGLEN